MKHLVTKWRAAATQGNSAPGNGPIYHVCADQLDLAMSVAEDDGPRLKADCEHLVSSWRESAKNAHTSTLDALGDERTRLTAVAITFDACADDLDQAVNPRVPLRQLASSWRKAAADLWPTEEAYLEGKTEGLLDCTRDLERNMNPLVEILGPSPFVSPEHEARYVAALARLGPCDSQWKALLYVVTHNLSMWVDVEPHINFRRHDLDEKKVLALEWCRPERLLVELAVVLWGWTDLKADIGHLWWKLDNWQFKVAVNALLIRRAARDEKF